MGFLLLRLVRANSKAKSLSNFIAFGREIKSLTKVKAKRHSKNSNKQVKIDISVKQLFEDNEVYIGQD